MPNNRNSSHHRTIGVKFCIPGKCRRRTDQSTVKTNICEGILQLILQYMLARFLTVFFQLHLHLSDTISACPHCTLSRLSCPLSSSPPAEFIICWLQTSNERPKHSHTYTPSIFQGVSTPLWTQRTQALSVNKWFLYLFRNGSTVLDGPAATTVGCNGLQSGRTGQSKWSHLSSPSPPHSEELLWNSQRQQPKAGTADRRSSVRIGYNLKIN